MKILIADDNNDKIARVLELLIECGISRDDVQVAYTVLDAKRVLRDTAFDLLILDVMLPVRAGDTPRHMAAVDLLTELVDRSTMRKPAHIIGLTAYDDALRDAGAAFVARTWTVIKFAFETNSWKDQIRACVRYIVGTVGQTTTRTYKTDLCIITALANPEFDAVMRLDWEWDQAEPIDDNTFVRRGRFNSAGVVYKVTAANSARMGMVSAALLTAKIIEREAPRFVVMAGICAGVEGKANLGDVVVADPTWDWQSGKHFVEQEERGFAIAPEPIGVASFIRARLEQMRLEKGIWNRIRENWIDPPETELRLRVAPMASGSSVLADSDIVARIVEQNRNLTAIEMEAFGVAAAASMASHPRPTAFVCKAVCDYANEKKDDRWRGYAAYCSAQTIREFFGQYMGDIVNLAGTR
jgi:nucleoside phosphorylase/CheY-like chemotaxis protein